VEPILSESRHRIDLALKDANCERDPREGVPFEVTTHAPVLPRYVMVIFYDYAADLLGSAIVRVK
jgi:hypothetical protein